MVKKCLYLLLTMILILGLGVDTYAATATITLEQAKSLARIHSRELNQLKISSEKAEYQLDRAENQQSEEWEYLDNLSANYSSLQAELADLQQQLANGDSSVAGQINTVQAQLQTVSEKYNDQMGIVSSSTTKREAEDAYEDSAAELEAYKERLDYNVEKVYTSILTQSDALQTLQEEAELNEKLLAIEETRCQLGNSSQYQVDKLSSELAALKQRCVEANDTILQTKGTLNDYMGKEYDQEIELETFTVPEIDEVPDLENILTKTAENYLTLAQMERDIEQSENDLYATDDYYDQRLQNLELKNKELQLENEKTQIEQTISNLISDYKAKQESCRIADINYDNSNKSYAWDKRRFGLGQISRISLMQSELTYLQAKDKKSSSEYALYLAKQSLKLAEKGIF